MSLKTIIRDVKFRFKYGPNAKYATELPPNVRRSTDAEDQQLQDERQALPVIRELYQHSVGVNSLEERIGKDLYAKLCKQHKTFVAKHCRDFSCGIATAITRSGKGISFEPYDLERKVSEHLATFLKKHGFDA